MARPPVGYTALFGRHGTLQTSIAPLTATPPLAQRRTLFAVAERSTHRRKALVSSSWFSRSVKMASVSRSTSSGPPKGLTGGGRLRLFCL